MTNNDKILADLLIGQSTAGALADLVSIPEAAAHALCLRMQRDGLLETSKIADRITVWRLTDTGRELAAPLNPDAAANPFATPA